MAGLKVLHPGALATIQDLGRCGYQKMGFSPSGALDDYSFRLGNAVLGNGLHFAAIEMVLWAATFEVVGETAIAVTGGEVDVFINGRKAPMWEALPVEPGDLIEMKQLKTGFAAYVCVAGGVQVPPVMGSRATDLLAQIGGLHGRPLQAGAIVPAGSPVRSIPGRRRIRPQFRPDFSGEALVRVIMGPQEDHFSPKGIETFLTAPYTVSVRSNRIGLRLEGKAIEHAKGAGILSEGISTGAIQVPEDGLPILLLAGRQTVGGYAKIAVVASADLFKAAQRKPGDVLRFAAIGVDEAHRILLERERLFANPPHLVE